MDDTKVRMVWECAVQAVMRGNNMRMLGWLDVDDLAFGGGCYGCGESGCGHKVLGGDWCWLLRSGVSFVGYRIWNEGAEDCFWVE